MRNTLFYAIVGALALTIAGCQKALDAPSKVGKVSDANGSLSAVIADDDSKTSLDNLNLTWSKGDKIAVISDYDYNLRTYTLSGGWGTKVAVFNADDVVIGGTEGTVYAAYYPASAVSLHGGTTKGQRKGLWYPHNAGADARNPLLSSFLYEQTYYEGRPDPSMMFMRAYGSDLSKMAFKNMTSVIKISLYDTRGENASTVSKIQLTSNCDDLTHTHYFDWRNYDIDANQFVNKYYAMSTKQAYLTYVVLSGIDVKLTSTPTDFYIVVNGGSKFEELTVSVFDENGKTQSKTKTSSFTTVAGRQYILPPFECTIISHDTSDGMYYKADGAADWTKWESGVPSFESSLALKTENSTVTESFISDLASAVASKTGQVSVDMSGCRLGGGVDGIIPATFPSSFQGNKRLVSIKLPGNTGIVSEYAFYQSGLTSVTLPEGLQKIGSYAFQKTKLERLDIPASVTSIGYFNMWDNPGSTGYVVDSSNANYSSEDGLLYDKQFKTLIEVPSGKVTGSSYIVKSGVEKIGSYAFYQKQNLETLTLPSSVTSIGSMAFRLCYKLSTLRIENASSVVKIMGTSFEAMVGKNASEREIFVPESMIESYRMDEMWSKLENRTDYPFTIKSSGSARGEANASIDGVYTRRINTF